MNRLRQSNNFKSDFPRFYALFIFHGREKFRWKKHDVFWLARFLYTAIRIIVSLPFVANRDEVRL